MYLLYDGVTFAHLLYAGRKHQSYHSGKSLRDNRYCKGNGDHQCFDDLRLIYEDLAHEHKYAENDAGDAQHHGYAV